MEGAAANDLDRLPRIFATEEARIGDVNDPERGFSRIAGVDVDRDGNVYVGEASVPEIRVYSPAGQLLRRIGRRGGGPGEFEPRFAPRFGVVGDTVWALSGMQVTMITLFDRQGTLLSTGSTEGVRIPLPEVYGYVMPNAMRSDGRFGSRLSLIASNRDDPSSGVQPTDRIPVPIVLFDASGAVTDTIGWAPRPPPRMWRPPSEEPPSPATVVVDGRRTFAPNPPTTLPVWEPVIDGYLTIETPIATSPEEGAVLVTKMGLADDTIYSRTLRYRPIPYSAADLDSIAASAARRGGGFGVPMGGSAPPVPDNWEAIAAAFRGVMDFPEFQVPIARSWLAQDESLWLARHREGSPVTDWVILDRDGNPRGGLELPAGANPQWSRGDVLWAVVPDEFDVQWLVRYTLSPA
jgi:hypothetical protein